MELNLNGKVAIVSGGNKGLGAACAKIMASEGARLFLTARNLEDLNTVKEELIEEFGSEVATFATDITGNGAGDQIVAGALDQFGQVDILINAAGAARGGLFWEIDDQTWRDAFELKFLGAVKLTRAVIPHMRDRKAGRIVNIIGMFGREPANRALPASAVNAAFMAINKGLSQELGGDGIFVNAVDPGPTRSERILRLFEDMARANNTTAEALEGDFKARIPIGRLGEVDEVARVVAFLASEASGNVNGTVLAVDGGMSRGLF